MTTWHPTSWQNKSYTQWIDYSEKDLTEKVLNELSSQPPLIQYDEILELKAALSHAETGSAFILQAGDCAESFSSCDEDYVNLQLSLIREMGQVLQKSLQKPIIHVGRIAGQYAKPRTLEVESKDQLTLPTYRGDLLNRVHFNPKDRTFDPSRMLEGYITAKKTLNVITESNLYNSTVYTSHEALHLPYEQALTRYVDEHNAWYNLSTHFPWCGMRTSDVDGSHIEYLRGIENPVAIKVGPRMTEDKLIQLLNIIDPNNEPGRISLVCRFGKDLIQDLLPKFIKRVKAEDRDVIWICDPMHGNTYYTKDGIKTRQFDDISNELNTAIHIHGETNAPLGGVHLEVTGENVTECLGGPEDVTEATLSNSYKTLVDPRLNPFQTLELTGKITS